MPDELTISEVVERYQVERNTLQQALYRGGGKRKPLDAHKRGDVWFITRESIEKRYKPRKR